MSQGSGTSNLGDGALAFPPDPLCCDLALPLRGVFHPFGLSVEISTNSEEVLECAAESWGFFPRLFAEPAVTLNLAVSDDGSAERPPLPVFRARGHLLSIISDSANFSIADLNRGIAFGWATRTAVRNHPYFRYHFLEGTVLTTLESLYLTSLHAGCVAWQERGVLLCGDASAGKSSLAFACARKGWTLISDDGASIMRNRNDRVVIGNPYQVRFREDAPRLFPELAVQRLVRGLDGELAIELPTRNLPALETALRTSIDYVLFLNRQDSGPARLLPYSPERARRRLEQTICFGEESVRAAQREALHRILTAEVLEFRYHKLDSAIACMRELVARNDTGVPLPTETVIE